MPRLLALIPCQKAMIDSQDNLPSAIGFINGIQIGWNPNVPIPADAAAPMKWGIVSSWKGEEEDKGKEFEQKLQLVMPDGSIKIDAVFEFHMRERNHHTAIAVENFPFSSAGITLLKTYWREKGQEKWTYAGEYPLDVEINFSLSPPLVPA